MQVNSTFLIFLSVLSRISLVKLWSKGWGGGRLVGDVEGSTKADRIPVFISGLE